MLGARPDAALEGVRVCVYKPGQECPIRQSARFGETGRFGGVSRDDARGVSEDSNTGFELSLAVEEVGSQPCSESGMA